MLKLPSSLATILKVGNPELGAIQQTPLDGLDSFLTSIMLTPGIMASRNADGTLTGELFPHMSGTTINIVVDAGYAATQESSASFLHRVVADGVSPLGVLDGDYAVILEHLTQSYEPEGNVIAGSNFQYALLTVTGGSKVIGNGGSYDFTKSLRPLMWICILDSLVGNNGAYQIDTVDSDSQITLLDNMPASEPNLKFAIGGQFAQSTIPASTADKLIYQYEHSSIKLQLYATPLTANQLLIGRVTVSSHAFSDLVDMRDTNLFEFRDSKNGSSSVKSVSGVWGYTALPSDFLIEVDCTGHGLVDILLPTAASMSGRALYIKKVDSTANVVSILPNGIERIDTTLATYTLNLQYPFVVLTSDGVGWLITSRPLIGNGARILNSTNSYFLELVAAITGSNKTQAHPDANGTIALSDADQDFPSVKTIVSDGGISHNVTEYTDIGSGSDNYAVQTDDYLIAITNTTRASNVILPLASKGKIYIIKKMDAGAYDVVIYPAAYYSIEGSSSYTLSMQNQFVVLQSNGGARWNVIGSTPMLSASGLVLNVHNIVNSGSGTVTYNVTLNDYMVMATLGGGGFVLAILPPAATNPGRVYVFKKIGTIGMTVDPDGTDKINSGTPGTGYPMVVDNKFVMLQSDGVSNWNIISAN